MALHFWKRISGYGAPRRVSVGSVSIGAHHSIRLVADSNRGNKRTYTAKLPPTGQPLILVGDVSADATQQEWGLEAVLATLDGDVLWEAVAWMRLLGASTTLLEATIVHEAAPAVLDSVRSKEAKLELLRFANNQTAVIRLQHRPMATACVELLQRVEAAEELHVAGSGSIA